MSYPAYPECQDPGVRWLGEVPKHWEIAPLKSQASYNDEVLSEKTTEDFLLQYVEIADVDSTEGIVRSTEYPFAQAPSRARRIVRDGDVLISTVRTYLRAIAPVQTPPKNMVASTGFAVVRPSSDGLSGGFLGYLLRAEWLISEIISRSVGVSYPAIGASELMGLNVPVPSPAEQTQIARFLDHQTARIDALIAEQQRLIELLKEKRQALTLSCFFSDESSEVRLENVAEIIERPVYQREGEQYVALGLFNRGRGLFHKEPRGKDEMGESDFFWVDPDDLIISGQFAWEGAVALAGEEEVGTVVSHRYPILRGNKGIALTEYIFSLLTTSHGDFLLNENSRGAAGRNRPLNVDALLKEKIKLPPLTFQSRIADLVHKEGKVREEVEKQKKLLLEHRSALISAAVTGKIDVRDWEPATSETFPQSTDSEEAPA